MLILEIHGTFDFPGGGADPISPSGSAHWPFKRVWMGGGVCWYSLFIRI